MKELIIPIDQCFLLFSRPAFYLTLNRLCLHDIREFLTKNQFQRSASKSITFEYSLFMFLDTFLKICGTTSIVTTISAFQNVYPSVFHVSLFFIPPFDSAQGYVYLLRATFIVLLRATLIAAVIVSRWAACSFPNFKF